MIIETGKGEAFELYGGPIFRGFYEDYDPREPLLYKEDVIPVKIIYNNTATICYFKDGSKEVAKCTEGEKFIKEVGVMSCIMKKLFEHRNDFKRLVASGYEQPPQDEVK